jgi:transcriptional regulator with XRE-family HTH domain
LSSIPFFRESIPYGGAMGNLIADLVNKLFETHRRQDGREYTNIEVARTIGKIDASYLTKLRSGRVNNPTRDTLLALCQFFKVEPSYFFPELNLAPSPPQQLQAHQYKVDMVPEIAEKVDEILNMLRTQTKNKEENNQSE